MTASPQQPSFGRRVRRVVFVYLPLAIVVLLVATPLIEDEFEQVEYFKADNRFRMFAFRLRIPASEVSETRLLEHARSQPNTRGRDTIALYYEAGDEIPSVTGAFTYAGAWSMVAEERHARPLYAYRGFNRGDVLIENHGYCASPSGSVHVRMCNEGEGLRY